MKLVLFAFAVIALSGCNSTKQPTPEQPYESGIYEYRFLDVIGVPKEGNTRVNLYDNNNEYIGDISLPMNTAIPVMYNDNKVCFGDDAEVSLINQSRIFLRPEKTPNNCYIIKSKERKRVVNIKKYNDRIAKHKAKRKAKEEAKKATRALYANVAFDTFTPTDSTERYCKTLANNAQAIYQNRRSISHTDAIRAASSADYQMIINAIYYRGYVPNKDIDLRDCLYYWK